MANLTTVPLAGSPITPGPLVANPSAVSGSPTWPTHQPIMVTGSAGVNPHGAFRPTGRNGDRESARELHESDGRHSLGNGRSVRREPDGNVRIPTSGASGAILSSGGSGVNPIGASGPPGIAGAGAAQSAIRPGQE